MKEMEELLDYIYSLTEKGYVYHGMVHKVPIEIAVRPSAFVHIHEKRSTLMDKSLKPVIFFAKNEDRPCKEDIRYCAGFIYKDDSTNWPVLVFLRYYTNQPNKKAEKILEKLRKDE